MGQTSQRDASTNRREENTEGQNQFAADRERKQGGSEKKEGERGGNQGGREGERGGDQGGRESERGGDQGGRKQGGNMSLGGQQAGLGEEVDEEDENLVDSRSGQGGSSSEGMNTGAGQQTSNSPGSSDGDSNRR
jgi:hypothetical protein